MQSRNTCFKGEIMKLAIVGIFYDGYEDLWYDFLALFNKHWKDCPYSLYIVNNEKEINKNLISIEKLQVIHAGKDAEYSKKVQTALTQIEADYYLLLLEDFFVSQVVSTAEIESIARFVEKNEIDYYTMPMPEFVDKKEGERSQGFERARNISANKEYLFSCQPSIWKKEFLKLLIGKENFNAWIFEGIYAKNNFLRNNDFLSKSLVDYTNPLKLVHGALQGKMLPNTVKKLQMSGYKLTTQRAVLTKKENAKHEFKKLVHKMVKILNLNRIVNKIKKESVLDKYAKEIEEYGKKTISKDKIDEYMRERDGN